VLLGSFKNHRYQIQALSLRLHFLEVVKNSTEIHFQDLDLLQQYFLFAFKKQFQFPSFELRALVLSSPSQPLFSQLLRRG
jgi:hypothetical protein